MILDFFRRAWPALVGLAVFAVLALVAISRITAGVAEQRAVEGAHARAGAVTSKAGEKATGAALEATAAYGDRELSRQSQEQETRDAVLSAPNAADDAGRAGDAGLDGLCRRTAYRDHPRCAGLRRPHSAPASR